MNKRFEALLKLSDPVNDLFDNVLIMCEDENVRANRLLLLKCVSNLVNDFVHVEKLVNDI